MADLVALRVANAARWTNAKLTRGAESNPQLRLSAGEAVLSLGERSRRALVRDRSYSRRVVAPP